MCRRSTNEFAAIVDWLDDYTVSDVCDSEPTVTHNFSATTIDYCTGADITVTWTAVDDCGNSNTATATIVVAEDVVAPTITAPSNLSISCVEDQQTNFAAIVDWLDDYTVSDVCDSEPTVTHNFSATTIDYCTGADITVTWTAVDDCGNSNTATATIVVAEDIVAPTITAPSDLNISCVMDQQSNQLAINAWLETYTVSDVCDSEPTVSYSLSTSAIDYCVGDDITVTWTAVDDCGNTNTATASIVVVQDVTAPVITAPADLTISCEMNQQSNQIAIDGWIDNYTVSDGCDSEPTVTVEYSASTIDYCTGDDITVTWTAVDDCGNTNTATALIVVEPDVTVPVINTLADLTLDCASISNTTDPSALVAQWLENNYTASDNCQLVDVSYNYSAVTLDVCTASTTVVTWTATDACGLTATATASLIVTPDETNPEIETLADLTIDCASISNTTDPSALVAQWLENNYTASDNCQLVDVSYNYSAVTLDVCTASTTVVTWTATDACGLTATATASLIVTPDETNPEIETLANLTIDCASISNTTDPSALVAQWLENNYTASDNCQLVDVSYNYSAVTLDVCTASTTVVTWTATDACGLTSTATASLIVTPDETNPEIETLADLTIDCASISNTTDPSALVAQWLENNYTASDNCQLVDVSYNYSAVTLDVCTASTTVVTWTATDACGLTATATASLIVTPDETNPEIETLADLTIDCASISNTTDPSALVAQWLENNYTASDNCQLVDVSYNYSAVTLDVCTASTTVVTWTATDACGLTATATASLIVTPDETNPEIETLADLTIDCASISNTTDPTALVTQWLENNYTASDNCQLVDVSYDYTPLTLDVCVGSTTLVTWTATDACGLTSTATSNLIITPDVTDPTITAMASNLLLECDGTTQTDDILAWLNNNGGATATDECSDPVLWSHDFTALSDLCGATGTTTVTFTATDACGNTSTTIADIIISDNVAPVISCQDNIEIDCDITNSESIITNWLTTVSATDICGDVTITNNYADVAVTDPTCGTVVTVTFTATDACGNSDATSVCTATITYVDLFNPIVMVPPMDIYTECGGDGSTTGGGGGTSNPFCDIRLSPLGNGNGTQICFPSGSGINLQAVIFSLDPAGTQFTVSPSGGPGDCFRTDDDTPGIPIMYGGEVLYVVDGQIITCEDLGGMSTPIYSDVDEWLANFGGMVSTDACDEDVEITISQPEVTNLCGGTSVTKYTFTATDDCGNSISEVAYVHIVDTTDPTVTAPVAGTADCSTDNALTWAQTATAADVCDNSPIVDIQLVDVSEVCTATQRIKTYTYSFRAIDDCGNSSEAVTSTYTVTDDIDPSFTTVPEVCAGGTIPSICLTNAAPACMGVNAAEQVVWYGGDGVNFIVTDDGTCASVTTTTGANGGVYQVCVDVLVGSCTYTYCQDILLKPNVDATLQDQTFCGSISQNIDLTSLFTSTTSSGGEFSIVSAVNASGNNINGTDVNLASNPAGENTILFYNENGNLNYTIVIQYEVGNPNCELTANDEDADDCYMIDQATLTITGGHDAFLDLPEDVFCTQTDDADGNCQATRLQLYKYTSIEDVSLNTLTVDGDGILEPGEIRYLVSAVNGTIAECDDPSTPEIDGFIVDADGDGICGSAGDLDIRDIIDISCTGGVDGVSFGPVDPSADPTSGCPWIDLSILNVWKDLNLTIRVEYMDGSGSEQCVALAEDNLWVEPYAEAELMNGTEICSDNNGCNGPGTINLYDLFTTGDCGPTTVCGDFFVQCAGDVNLNLGADPNDTNSDGVFGPGDDNYPCYDFNWAGADVTQLSVKYSLTDEGCNEDEDEVIIPICPVVDPAFADNTVYEDNCTEGSSVSLFEAADLDPTSDGTWYGPFATNGAANDAANHIAANQVASPANMDPCGVTATLADDITENDIYAFVTSTVNGCTACPPAVSRLRIGNINCMTESCAYFGNGETYDGSATNEIEDGYCSTALPTTPDPLLLRKVCPEIVMNLDDFDADCDVENPVSVPLTDVFVETQLSVSIPAGTFYPNATINDDWFIQLFYINNDLDQSDNNPTLDDDPACDGSTVGVVNDGMNDPARDLDGGDHTGFIFAGSGLTNDYVVTRDNCPTDFINSNLYNGTVSPNLVRMMDIEYNTTLNGDYDPSTPQNLELLGIGSPSCSTPAMPSIGDNDYFILEFTAKDIYAMYDDGDASNGDGKKDFLREFFTGNCDQDVSFTWDIGANTQGEFTDYGMLLSGMKVINYKEDVTFYSDEFQCPKATCDTGAEDLGFTISWVGHDCESPETTDFSGYPAWLTSEMLADAITVAESGLADPDCPESSCYDVMLDIDQFMPPACDLTAYTFEVCHTVETCSESCDGDNSYTYCRTFTTEREHVPNSDRSFAENGFDDLLQLGCIESDKLYFDECKLYDFFNPYTLAADGGFPSDAGAVVNADGHIACDAYDCDQSNPSDPDGDLGSWSVPAPFSTYIIQNGSEFAVLQNIWADYTGGAFDPCSYSAPTFDSYADFGLPNPNEAYPCSENSDKQLLIPVEYTFKACSLCEEEVLVRYLHITRTPEVTLAIQNSPGVCPQDATIICLEEDCEWPNCTFDLILTNAGSHYLAAADGDLAGGNGLPTLPNDCDEANCGGTPAAMAPGITMIADCDGNGTPGIRIDWAVLTEPGGYLDQAGEQLLGDFNLELIVYCGVGACGTDPGAYCSDSDDQDLFFLGEVEAAISDRTVCGSESYDLSGMFTNNATTPTGTWEYSTDGGTTWTMVIGDEINGANAPTQLAAGTYEIRYTVGPTTSCEESDVATLTIYTISLSASHVDPLCADSEDGTMTVTVSDGVSPYTYAWSSGTTNTGVASATNTETGLHAGGYSVTVTDANGCTAEVSDLLSDPEEVVLLVTAENDVDCFGNSTGSATVAGSGGVTTGGAITATEGYQYLWTPTNQTTATATGLAAGLYTVMVTDDNGCTAQVVVEIEQPTLLIAEIISSTDVSCNGDSDGTATVNATGGTTPYTYEWPNSQTGNTGTDLAVGDHTVTVTDANGCEAEATVTIGEPDELTLSLAYINDVSCNGGSDGDIYINTNGGTGPYNYFWFGNSAADNTQDAVDVPAGTYSITVIDANGCTFTLSDLVVGEPTPVTVSIGNVMDADCAGNETGEATATGMGGTGTITYLWSNGQAGANATGLHAGGYSVTATDANGCTAEASTFISDPNGLLFEVIDVTNVTCNGDADGSIQLGIEGGTAPYTLANYFGSGAVTLGTPIMFNTVISGLPAGSHTFVAADANGCIVVTHTTIDEPTLLIAEIIATTDALCNGSADGTATVNATGGTTDYSYAWSTTPVQTTATATGLAAGTYTAVVTDANDCTAETTVTIGEPDVLEITSITGTDALCDGGSDGSIAITVTGGTEEYHYLWSNGSTDFVATGLSAGTYTVTVTDENGCTDTATETIDDPDPIVITIEDITNADCDGGETGSAEVSAVGGTGAITFAWSNGDTGNTATELHAGGYSVTATDANGCTAQVSLSITDPNGMSMEVIESSQPWCHGDENGIVTLGILQTGNLGGTPPYTLTSVYHEGDEYSVWIPFSGNTLTLDDLGAGQYSFVVKDDLGCEVAADFTMDEPHLLIAEIIATTDALCHGSSDGTATVNATGGTTGYTYEWPNGQTSATATGLAAGSYTVTVTDENDCEATATATIGEPDELQLIGPTSITNVSCNGGSDGAIYLSVIGGTGTYNYTWANGQPADNVQDALNIPAGTYSVTVTDSNGCTDAIEGIVVTEPDPISIDIINVVNANCAGNEDGSAEADASGGTGTLTFAWSNGDNTAIASGLHAGGYSVTVTDANGCTAQASVSITDPTAMSLEAITNTSPSCNGGTDGSVTLAILQTGNLGGTPPYTLATIYKDGDLLSSPGTPFPGTNGDNPLLVDNLEAGQYSFIVVDANGCEVVEEQTISEPTLLIAETIHTTDALCNGSADGTATVNATGGTTGYTYEWSDGQTTATATGLAAGTYTVTVTDANDCTAETTATIGEPTEIVATIDMVTNVSCADGADGSIFISVEGGTPPYSYDWSASADDVQDATGLVAGTYNVTITDSNGCTTELTDIEITQPTPVTVTIGNVVNADCAGNETGSATATGMGGTGTITYAWSNGQTGATATELHAGGYSVTATDENGCTAQASTSISDPNGLDIVVSDLSNVSCNGGNDGSVTIGVTIVPPSGTPPYILAGYYRNGVWSGYLNLPLGPVTGFNHGIVVNDLTAGQYSFYIDDANGCRVSISTTVDEPTLLIAETIHTTDALCFGSADGTATVNATGGTTGYTYLWFDGQTTATATGLAAGTYTVVVTDANDCTAETTATIGEPTAVNIFVQSVENVSCNGGSDGNIFMGVTGGTGPYNYDWAGLLPADNTQDALSIPAGTYTVTVTDANGCTDVASDIIITEPTPVVLTVIDVTNADCAGTANGTATVEASGGTSPYDFDWSTGLSVVNLTSSTATELTAGGYSVTVTDANGCTEEISVTITDPLALEANISAVMDVTCYGGNDGSATVNVSGGSGTYNYLWSDGQTTATAINLSEGLYTVVVSDPMGTMCDVIVSVSIDEPTLLIAEIISTTDETCPANDDGTATVNATGGTTGYTYAWSNGDMTATATGLASGTTYTVTVTDANGCEAIVTVTVDEPIELTGSTTQVDVLCFGDATGSIDLTLSGGTGPFSYVWSGTAQDVEDPVNLIAGTYDYTVTDANGCTTTGTVTITEPTELTVGTTLTNADCAGTENGTATATAVGGTPDYSYVWSDGQTTATAVDLTAGGYSVTVTDANGCTVEASVTIADPLALEANISATTDVSCNGGDDGSATVNASGGSGTYNYLWSDGQTTATAVNLTAGLYTVVVSDPAGSMCDIIVSVTITEPTALIAEIISSTNETCDGANDGSAIVNATGGTTGYTYTWSTTPVQIGVTASNLEDGTYTVTVTDANSCETTTTVTIDAGPVLAIADISDVTVCPGAAVAAISLSSIPPNAEVEFAWTAGGGLSAGSTPAGGSQNPEIPGFIASTTEGTYTITVTATLGNCIATTTFDVIVDDTEAPVFINCPSNIVVGNDPDNCSATVNWTIPAATDGCAGLPIVPTASASNEYSPGDDIPVGVHTIEYIATDGNGNTSTCTFTITVLDTESPEFITTLPADETVECDAIPDPFVVIPMMHTADNCTEAVNIIVEYGEEIIDEICANTYTIVRTWTIIDEAGNSAVHKQKVYVQDTTAPTFTVPVDVTIECDASIDPANTGDVTDEMDNCDPAPVVTYTDVEDLTGCGGYTGTITRTWTVTDACGNETTQVQVITVEDNIDPVAMCQNITVELDENGLVVISANQINNGSTDNCADVSDLTLSLSKSMFDCSNIGENLVTLTVTDPCGNFGVCVATVTVEDNIAPVITCPDDITVHLDPGACEQFLSFDILATDNCDVTVTQIGGLYGSGDAFPIGGPYTLTYEATDGTNSVTCSFDVTVVEYQTPTTTLACNGLINLSLDSDCQACITPDMILEGGPYACYDDYTIMVMECEDPSCPPIPTSPCVDLSHVGDTLVVKVIDEVTGLTCWGYVYIEDKLVPEFDCPADIDVTCIDATAPSFTGEPVLTSCEASTTTIYEDVFTDFGCSGDPNDSSIRASVVRTWTVTDDSGNSSTCTQTINVLKPSLSDVEFPADNDNINGVALECSDVASDPTLILPINTGVPQIATQDLIAGGLCAFSIGYEDNELQVCPGGASYEIIRTWTVRNLCEPLVPGVNPIQHLQSILVIDTEGPEVIAPADITISTSSTTCDANFVLPSANITDVCSGYDAVTVTPNGTLGSNGGTVPQPLGLGTHTITYIGTDGCGNVGYDVMTITVEDQIAPIAICDEHTTVGLDNTGFASIDAITFDDGSHDNCSDDLTLEVRKMTNICDPTNNAFGSSVSFCCEEVGTIVMVEMRVTDEAGNINSCMVEVEVQDKIDPTLVCAPDKDVDCSATYLDYIEVGQPLPQDAIDANGEAIASDNCTGVTLTNNVISNTVDCGNGIVNIVWTATDAGGRTTSCIQQYIVTNDDPFNIVDTEHRNYLPLDQLGLNGEFHTLTDDVEWPVDYEATTCGNGLEPEDLSSPYDYPIIYEGACDNIAVGHHDQLLDFGAADACLKILRKWHVIDWCQASANQDPTQPGPGVWHYTQIIKVVNSNDPNVTVVDFPSVVDNYEEDCGETLAEFTITVDDDCTAQDDIEVTWEFSNGETGTGTTASDNLENGSYSVTFTVSDLCGNTVWETHDFTVVDAKKPTPVCIFGIATTVMPSSGSVTISATDFESGSSSDNCTAYDDLVFSFSQDVNELEMIITCDDVPPNGLVPVTLYVTDEAGNFDFCSTFIDVQDPNIVCPNPTGLITGKIENEYQELIEEVTVTLSDDNGMNIPVITGPTGVFQFNQTYGDYDVTPEKDINYLNGVTTYDLVLISKHILGLELLDSPYKMIAADANNSHSITALDLVKLRALILYLDDELSNNTSWRFVEQDYIFPDPNNPWLEEFPEFTELDTTVVPANFIATKIGDVNGSASPNSLLGTDTRTFSGNLALQLEATKVAEGETFTVDFKAKDFRQIAGYQFTLGFDNDAIEFVDVTSNLQGLESKNFGLAKLEEGVITTSWNSSKGVDVEDNTILFSMTFLANTTANTTDLFTINSRYTESEAYNGTDLFDVVLEFNGNEVESIFKLYQNIPNPFREETTISFNLPESGAVTLRITDVAGRTLKLINMDAVKGMNSVKLNRDEFDATGVLYYQLESANNTATMKMIIVD